MPFDLGCRLFRRGRVAGTWYETWAAVGAIQESAAADSADVQYRSASKTRPSSRWSAQTRITLVDRLWTIQCRQVAPVATEGWRWSNARARLDPPSCAHGGRGGESGIWGPPHHDTLLFPRHLRDLSPPLVRDWLPGHQLDDPAQYVCPVLRIGAELHWSGPVDVMATRTARRSCRTGDVARISSRVSAGQHPSRPECGGSGCRCSGFSQELKQRVVGFGGGVQMVGRFGELQCGLWVC
jgi:hypothetical protein